MTTKYKSKKTIVNNKEFDSVAESEYYKLLLRDEKRGKITEIELQPVFELQSSYKMSGKTIKAITYKADFKYFDIEKQKYIIVDVKGMATEVANIKRKMFNYIYGSEYELIWVVKNKKWGNADGWCEYDLLKKLRAKAKRQNKIK